MSSKNVVEVIYGKYHKYEIVKTSGGMFSSSGFAIYRDGEFYKKFETLSRAVEVAKKEGGV